MALRTTASPPRARLAGAVVLALLAALAVLGPPGPVPGAPTPAGATVVHGGYVPLTSPRRVLDTRSTTAVAAGTLRTVTVTATGGIPLRVDIGALVVNVTAVGPTDATHVTVWGGGPRPNVSTLNVAAGETRANFAAVVPGSGAGGQATLTVATNSGLTHVLVDVVGYFRYTGGTADELVPAPAPFRLADSRTGFGFAGAFGPNQTRTLTVSTASSVVPKTATAVVVNLTAVGPTAPTHLKAYGAGLAPLGTSVLNAPAGAVVPNLAIVRLTPDGGGNGRFSVTNAAGTVHVLVDVVGWFEPSSPVGLEYYPQAPTRLTDSRTFIPLTPKGIATLGAGTNDAHVL